jgi:hypothetical protein
LSRQRVVARELFRKNEGLQDGVLLKRASAALRDMSRVREGLYPLQGKLLWNEEEQWANWVLTNDFDDALRAVLSRCVIRKHTCKTKYSDATSVRFETERTAKVHVLLPASIVAIEAEVLHVWQDSLVSVFASLVVDGLPVFEKAGNEERETHWLVGNVVSMLDTLFRGSEWERTEHAKAPWLPDGSCDFGSSALSRGWDALVRRTRTSLGRCLETLQASLFPSLELASYAREHFASV